MKHYDYIIAGAGCAGLSLLQHIMQEPLLASKKICVVDKFFKNTNDRTWCFWEKEKNIFETIVAHSWKQLDFFSNTFSSRFNIAPYEYKLIRSIDFYNYVLSHAASFPNIEWHYGTVSNIATGKNDATLYINEKKISAQYIFNSISPAAYENFAGLLQHFKGWLIETNQPAFSPAAATFMDFRPHRAQPTAFTYMLPLTATKALVEYTLFSKNLLHENAYDAALKNYIINFLRIQNYQVLEQEFGIIPMSTQRFSQGKGNIINIGTAGGQTKASTGYTFQFIQKHSRSILNALKQNRHPLKAASIFKKRFHFYDSVLLDILSENKVSGEKIFTAIFQNNQPQLILKFLDNETSFFSDLKIMRSVDMPLFTAAFAKRFLKMR